MKLANPQLKGHLRLKVYSSWGGPNFWVANETYDDSVHDIRTRTIDLFQKHLQEIKNGIRDDDEIARKYEIIFNGEIIEEVDLFEFSGR